ncbi:MAG: hypothetical protein ACK4GT_04095 [Pararhodobacter sp.]
MSEAMTNREIEDVLTSIRRLVAQEGGRGAETGKLVLTEAQRVNGAPAARIAPAPGTLSAPETGAGSDEDDFGSDFGGDDDFAFDPADYDAAPFSSSSREDTIPAPDFGRLEATIAELEAAVTASGQGFEGEGEGPRASNVTALYGRMNFVHRDAGNITTKPEPVAAAPADSAAPPVTTAPVAEHVLEHPVQDAPLPAMPLDGAPATLAPEEFGNQTGDASGEETLDTVIDEAMLRQLIAQIVREELHGQLGERITQQVRKLVRAEIAKALDDRNFL